MRFWWNRINALETRVESLIELCARINKRAIEQEKCVIAVGVDVEGLRNGYMSHDKSMRAHGRRLEALESGVMEAAQWVNSNSVNLALEDTEDE